MFQGSIPASLRAVVHEAVRGWGSSVVWVGCSGNFTPELHPHAYLMSDFAVGDGSVPRLSALVLRAALSREAQLLYERALHRRCRGLVTTAFSRKPVSMKYRGLFDLHSRKESGDGKYVLNYKARVGEWTLNEGMEAWRKSLKKAS